MRATGAAGRVAVATAMVMMAATAGAAEDAPGYAVETVAQGLDEPWGLAFLPGGELLVSERPGRLRRIAADGTVSAPLDAVPEVYYRGQGGLLDLALHPDYANNGRVYFSYSHGNARDSATRVAHARLSGNTLSDVTVVFTARPGKDTPQHYAGSLAFLPDATLLVTIGDGFDYREQAQNLLSLLGKVVRIDADGGIPPDNPFVGRADAAPEIWTYGHRNPQGLAVDPRSGTVYLHEHGPRGGDEINVLEPGRNYGWPVITYGMDYSGAYVSPYTELPGMEQPLLYWVPSIAPSGFTIYRGARFPDWQGDLFLGALVDREVRRVDLEGGAVVAQESLLGEAGERIRNVKEGPDGALYVLTDSHQGQVLRLVPR